MEIIGRWGRPLKPGLRNVYVLQIGKGKVFRAELHKLIWCARHKANVLKIPKDYSFREQDGDIIVETLSERMSRSRKAWVNTVKVRMEDYDFVEQYVKTAKAMLGGDSGAKSRLFSLFNSRRDECIRYARKASGGVSQRKAELYTDQAILRVFEQVCGGTYFVASPVASIKSHINHAIRAGRKKRALNDEGLAVLRIERTEE